MTIFARFYTAFYVHVYNLFSNFMHGFFFLNSVFEVFSIAKLDLFFLDSILFKKYDHFLQSKSFLSRAYKKFSENWNMKKSRWHYFSPLHSSKNDTMEKKKYSGVFSKISRFTWQNLNIPRLLTCMNIIRKLKIKYVSSATISV